MLNYIIIEDEPHARELLRLIVGKKFPEYKFLAWFDKVSTAAHFIKENTIDFLFLDVQLNGELGTDIAEYLTAEQMNFDIIFTTAYDNFALDAFALSAIDYVLKPISELKLATAIKRVAVKKQITLEQLQVLQQAATRTIEKIIISTTDGKTAIATADIVYLKADNVYTAFYLTSGKKIVVSKPIKDYNMLIETSFFIKYTVVLL